MSFPFNLYTAAFISALLSSIALFPLWKRWCERGGHVDDPGHRKIHATPVPLAGGLSVFSAFFLPLMAGFLLLTLAFWVPGNPFNSSTRETLQYGVSKRTIQVLALLVGAFCMLMLGWLDDKHELSPKLKFLGQLIIAALVVSSGIRITLFIREPIINWAITILWILTVTNAFNFVDNMNGLCSGLGFIASWFCAWAAAIHGQYLVAILAFLICGALLGFIPFNFPKASSFLGDAGSHVVGFLAAVLSILPSFYLAEYAAPAAVLSPLFFLAVPLLDLLWVVIIRVKNRRPFYIGDTNHLSHRLVQAGLSKTTAVLILLLANTLAGFAAFQLFYSGSG